MAGFSYPFDDGPGSTITEDQWSYMMRDASGTGVHESSGGTPGPNTNELKVFSLAEPGLIYVNAGRATINGFHYQQGSSETIAVTMNSDVAQDRIDAMVLRLDLSTNAITLVAKLGVPSGTPVPPAITSNELLLATYRVRKNTNTVLTAEVTDRRVFVGRRMRVSDDFTGREGDMIYSPSFGRWMGLNGSGSANTFAYSSELQAHASASDPHPQYLTAAEGDAAYKVVKGTTGTLSFDSLWSNNGYYWRSLSLPGGFKIVRFWLLSTFNGTSTTVSQRIATLNETDIRPGVAQFYVAHQYIFANSTDDIPMIITVGSDGEVRTSGLNLMGGAHIVVSGMYFVGSGV